VPHAISTSGTSTTPENSTPAPEWLAGLGLERFVAIDLETTGITAASDEIIEVGAVLFEHGAPVDQFQSFLNPGKSLPPFIVQLTGITDRDLVGAPDFNDIHDELLKFIGDAPLVGQNINFDLSFLVASGGAAYRFPGKLILDTAETARIFWAEYPRFSLGNLCHRFGVELTSAHRAVDDAQATGEVLISMIRRLPTRVWADLADQLAALSSTAHHRADRFFESLRLLAVDLPPPTGQDIDSPDRDELTAIDEQVLTVGGVFERELPGFRTRPQQLVMADYVRATFRDESILLLEAPTGTGKSLGYLVPSLEWAFAGDEESSRQVVVSSHTRSLQEQLAQKEIADIGRAHNAQIPAAVLKGRENYLCKRRLRSALTDLDGRLSEGDRLKLLPLIRWSMLTKRGDVGEIGGFRPEHEPVLWSMVCSDGAACAGGLCGAHRGDFYRLALDQAKAAKLLLVNHALLATDFARFIGGEGAEKRLVIDEAHQFERAVVSAYTANFSYKVTRNTLGQLTDERAARGLLVKLSRDIKDEDLSAELIALDVAAKSLFQRARTGFQEAAGAKSQDDRSESRSRIRPNTPLQEHIEVSLASLVEELDDFERRLAKLADALSHESDLPKDVRDRVLELRSAAAGVTELVETGKRVLSADDSAYVYWSESAQQRGAQTVGLFASPISVAEQLDRMLWSRVQGAVLTSATLAHRSEFNVIETALGLKHVASERVTRALIDSPFNLEKQMRCYGPAFLPPPQQTGQHLDGVGKMLIALLNEIPRSCLVLCTSYASVEILGKLLTPAARKLHRPLYQQSSGRDTHELLRAFRESNAGILLGSSGMWEGIDLVGDALELLVVVKLPFDVPTDPWHEARGELAEARSEDPFYTLSIPSCTIRLRQGLGRLIRHADDRGVAIIADSRLITTRYGKAMQQSLPVPLNPFADSAAMIQDIHNFFDSKS